MTRFHIFALLMAGLTLHSARVRAEDSTPRGPISCEHHDPLAAADPLPDMSLYHLAATLTDQHGKALRLESFRGQPLLITMFYASCSSICPAIIAELKRVEALLSAAQRAKLHVVLVSLDPERDGVPQLAELAKRHGADAKRWHFTRTRANSVRDIAALLGVRYRWLPGGEIGHSALVALLDRDGVLVLRAEGTASDPKPIAEAVAHALDLGRSGPHR